MTNITTFNYLSSNVRVFQLGGDPWFVVADVCRAIDLYVKTDGTVNTTNALRCLSKDQYQVIDTPSQRGGKLNILSESGLYRLVMRSDKPEARQFQDWVTREVLPSIRKDGGYIAGEELVKTGELDEEHCTPCYRKSENKVKVQLDAGISAASASLHMA